MRRKPENRLFDHPVWAQALDGRLPKTQIRRLLLAIYPAVAGPGRYAFAAKVSQIDAADGKNLFLQLYDSLKKPEANADKGWRDVLQALGCSTKEIDGALAEPSAEAVDFVEVVRTHGLRSSAAEATVIAHMLERHLPRLWGKLAASLQKHYGLDRKAVAYLLYEANRAGEVDKWIDHLVDRYVKTADSYKMFEARRAGREAVWAWTVLAESAG